MSYLTTPSRTIPSRAMHPFLHTAGGPQPGQAGLNGLLGYLMQLRRNNGPGNLGQPAQAIFPNFLQSLGFMFPAHFLGNSGASPTVVPRTSKVGAGLGSLLTGRSYHSGVV